MKCLESNLNEIESSFDYESLKCKSKGWNKKLDSVFGMLDECEKIDKIENDHDIDLVYSIQRETLSLLTQSMEIRNEYNKQKQICEKRWRLTHNKLIQKMDKIRDLSIENLIEFENDNQLRIINSFEQFWPKWKINDTFEWFKYLFVINEMDSNILDTKKILDNFESSKVPFCCAKHIFTKLAGDRKLFETIFGPVNQPQHKQFSVIYQGIKRLIVRFPIKVEPASHY